MTSTHVDLGKPCPEWIEFFAKHRDVVPKLEGSPAHLRDIMEKLKKRAQSLVPLVTEGVTVKDTTMPLKDGGSIPLRIYTPTGDSTQWPCLVYIHGGGWTLGDLEGEDNVCRAVCVRAQVVLVSVDYRLAPEFPFPTGLDDSWEALNWTVANSASLKIDSSRLIIGGSSSGGNVAAVLAHRARDAGLNLHGQVLRIPAVCHFSVYPPELNLKSFNELEFAPVLSKISMETFWRYYDPKEPTHPDVSPLLASNFSGLAPAYVQIAGMDPLRDEGLAYVEKLKKAGIPVLVDIYPGLPHAFGYFPELPQAAKNGADLIRGIKSLLE